MAGRRARCGAMSLLAGRAALWGALLLPAGCRPAPRDLFVDGAAQAGLDFVHTTGAAGSRHLAETLSGGAAWLDYDQDGDLDLYLVNGNERPDTGGPGSASNRLYRNDGRGRFQDATSEAGVGDRGYGIGAATGDYDNDGYPDLYVANFAPLGEGGNVLYHNLRTGRFEDATARSGTAPGGWSTCAAFLDHDGDGFLDLYVARYVRYDPKRRCRRGAVPSYCDPNDFPGEPDVLYHNRGDGTFEDVSARAGIAFEDPAGGAGLGVLPLDFDEDGDTDIFVANDQGPNYLFRNDGGRFTETALAAGVAYGPDGSARAGMGVEAGDLDLDGRQDLVVTNFADEPDGVFLSEGQGIFRDAASELGVAGPTLQPLGFGVALTDFDLDGDLDLYIAEGHVMDNIAEQRPGSGHRFAQPDLLLENRGGKGFADISRTAGAWFQEARVGRGVAAADYDEDGDEDLLVVNAGGRPALLQNRAPRRGGWLALRLRGTRANRDGYGAQVAVLWTARDGTERARFFEARSARSYASASDPRVRVGLGPDPPAKVRAIVRWPGPAHTVEEYREVPTGRVTELVESPEEAARHPVNFPRPAPRPRAGPAPVAAESVPPPAESVPPPAEVAPAPAKATPPRGEPSPRPPSSTAPAAALLAKVRELRSSYRLAEALSVVESAAAADRGLSADHEVRRARAELLFSLHRPAEAGAVLEALVAEEPASPVLRSLLARVRCELGRYREALPLFEEIERAGTDLDGEARRAHGRALLECGRTGEARARIAAALARDPWLEPAYLDYGRVVALLGEPDRAAPFLARYRSGEEVRRREEDARDLLSQGRTDQARHARGEAEFSRGRAFRAMAELNGALLANPGHGSAHLALARLSARLERQEDALSHLARLPAAPEVAAARAEIEASLQPEGGEPARARASLRARMAGMPLSACTGELAELARALRRGGEPARAREVALFAAELDTRRTEAQRAVAEVFDAPGEDFIRLWALDRAARLEPGDRDLAARREALARELQGGAQGVR